MEGERCSHISGIRGVGCGLRGWVYWYIFPISTSKVMNCGQKFTQIVIFGDEKLKLESKTERGHFSFSFLFCLRDSTT